MNWTREQIQLAIEAKQWDYEPTLVVPGHTQLTLPNLLAMQNEFSTSILTNKIVHADFSGSADIEREIDAVFDFFGDKPFSWWIGPLSKPADLDQRLEQRGFVLHDRYIGLAYELARWQDTAAANPRVKTIAVATDEDIWKHVEISAQVWGMDERSRQSAFQERKKYLQLPDRRGGYLVAELDGRAVGNGAYRLSTDGAVMYLVGSATLPEARGQGVYHELLRHRFRFAREQGVQWITIQAREGTSEPILRKIGFHEYSVYKMMARP